jgi:hypothetical protein
MRTNPETPLDLPTPIAAYFAADVSGAGGVSRCFTEDAIVVDEHREHRGRQAIARWKANATAKYHYTSEPLTVDGSGTNIIILARASGDFPGSPIELRYCFTLEGDKIARLEIA